MRAPLSWLREYADLPADLTGRELGEISGSARRAVRRHRQQGTQPLAFAEEAVADGVGDGTGNVAQVAGAEARQRFVDATPVSESVPVVASQVALIPVGGEMVSVPAPAT